MISCPMRWLCRCACHRLQDRALNMALTIGANGPSTASASASASASSSASTRTGSGQSAAAPKQTAAATRTASAPVGTADEGHVTTLMSMGTAPAVLLSWRRAVARPRVPHRATFRLSTGIRLPRCMDCRLRPLNCFTSVFFFRGGGLAGIPAGVATSALAAYAGSKLSFLSPAPPPPGELLANGMQCNPPRAVRLPRRFFQATAFAQSNK